MIKKENLKLEIGWPQERHQDFGSNFILFTCHLANNYYMPGICKKNLQKLVLDLEDLTYSLEDIHINK